MGTSPRFGLGVALPNRGSLATPSALVALATRAEALRYDHVWVGDHIALPLEQRSPYPYERDGARAPSVDEPWAEAITTLGFLAGVTDRIGLGTRVLVAPLRHPVLAAKCLSTVDHLSNGRLLVGIGVGWLAEEFPLVGAPDFRSRGAVTDEYIRAFRALWTGQVSTFSGQFASIAGVRLRPRPVQRAGPPIWVGGHSDAALARAARLGDAWFPLAAGHVATELAPAPLAARIRRLREMTEEFNRDPAAVGVALSAPVALGSSRRDVLAGDPAAVADDLSAYAAVGVDTFVAVLGGDLSGRLRQLELFAEAVPDHLRNAV